MTYIFQDDNQEPITIVFYTVPGTLSQGMWNIDTNEVLLSDVMYAEWIHVHQSGRRLRLVNFFKALRIISRIDLPAPSTPKIGE